MQLVIAEKPSVGRSVASVIGATEKKDGYLVRKRVYCYMVHWSSGYNLQVQISTIPNYGTKISEWSFFNATYSS